MSNNMTADEILGIADRFTALGRQEGEAQLRNALYAYLADRVGSFTSEAKSGGMNSIEMAKMHGYIACVNDIRTPLDAR